MKSLKTTSKAILLACAASLALSACTDTEDQARKEIASTAMQGNVAKQAWKEQHDAAGPGNVRYRQDVWLGDEGSKSASGMPLPAVVEAADAFELHSDHPMGLVEIAKYVTMASGIEVSGANQLGLDRAGSGDLSSANEDPRNINAVIDYKGPLSGFLDMVSAKFGVSWEYKAGVVRIFDQDTRIFHLIAGPTTAVVTNKLKSTINAASTTSGSSSGSGSSSSGSSSDSPSNSEGGVNTTAKIDYWARVKTDVDSLVPEGTKWSISPEAGTVTVTGRPAVIERVERYVKQENRMMSRQVAVSITVLSISSTDQAGFSTDLDTVFKNAATGLGLTFDSIAPGMGIAGTALTGTLGKGDFNGSNLLIQAIKSRNDASQVTSAKALTLNNQPSPIQVSQTDHFIDSYDSSQSDSSTIVTPKTAELITGLSGMVLPRILPDNTVALNYSLGLSKLDEMKTYNFGTEGYPIQAPEVSSRGFQQNVLLRSGDTLVLGGFEQSTNSVDNQKTDLLSFLDGGNRNTNKSHQLFMILLTPVIVESPSDLARMK